MLHWITWLSIYALMVSGCAFVTLRVVYSRWCAGER